MKYENTLFDDSPDLLAYFLKLGILRVDALSLDWPKGLSKEEVVDVEEEVARPRRCWCWEVSVVAAVRAEESCWRVQARTRVEADEVERGGMAGEMQLSSFCGGRGLTMDIVLIVGRVEGEKRSSSDGNLDDLKLGNSRKTGSKSRDADWPTQQRGNVHSERRGTTRGIYMNI